ncbi:FTR1 family protein [Microaerobacter geothermalis]|uniref:FTR1 family iron permease n=1 Tax=Microaerobacter geothermalis TaxID=674972 RepID=UPI001F3005D6|nr:FTR1 family protein [Microaerobacter geothermalis]MCF6094592.1 FTR1 family protein [Microaerobacter geothermalis]
MNAEAFLISFREALEALLIVGVIITYLKKMGKQEFVKYVWVGVTGAVFSSFIFAFLFQVVLTSFAMMSSQTYMKLSIMLISSILLTQMVLWMADNSKELNSKSQQKLSELVTTGSVIGMIIHAYLIVLREGIETVFFFAAISKGDISQAIQNWGALSGLVLAVVLFWFIFKGALKFPIKTFFKVTGFIIIMIAAGLLVNAIGMMQDLGMIGSVMPELYNIAAFMPEHPIDEQQLLRDQGITPLISGKVGIFFAAMFGYSHNPSLEQVIAYIGYFVIVFVIIRFQARREDNSSKATKSQLNNESNAIPSRMGIGSNSR